jgi:glycerol-3-phosphate acyltransferase PlsY
VMSRVFGLSGPRTDGSENLRAANALRSGN